MNKTIRIAILTAAALATQSIAAYMAFSSDSDIGAYGIAVNADSLAEARAEAKRKCVAAGGSGVSTFDRATNTGSFGCVEVGNASYTRNRCIAIGDYGRRPNRTQSRFISQVDATRQEAHDAVLDICLTNRRRNDITCKPNDMPLDLSDVAVCDQTCIAADNEFVVDDTFNNAGCRPARTQAECDMVPSLPIFDSNNECRARIDSDCATNEKVEDGICEPILCEANEIIEDRECIVPTADAASANGDVFAFARFYDSRDEAANAAVSACADAGGVNCTTVTFADSRGRSRIFDFAECGVAFGVNLIQSGILVGTDIIYGDGDSLVLARRDAISKCNAETTEQACTEGFANSFEFCHSDANTGGEVLVAVTPNLQPPVDDDGGDDGNGDDTDNGDDTGNGDDTVTTDECGGIVLIADGSGGCQLHPLVCPAPHSVEGLRCVNTDTGQEGVAMITVTVTVTVAVLTEGQNVIDYGGEQYTVTTVAGTNDAVALLASGVHLRVMADMIASAMPSSGGSGGGGSAAGIIGGVVVVGLALWYFVSDSDDLTWTPSYAFQNNNGNLSYSVGSRWTATADNTRIYWQTRQSGNQFVYGSGIHYSNDILSAAMNSESAGKQTDLDFALSANKTVGLWDFVGGYNFDMELSDTETDTQNRLNAKIRYTVDKWILSANANTDGKTTRTAVNYSYRF